MKIAPALIAILIAASAVASDTMPAAQQTALVQKYCAVCHNDAHVNGGLSLEHFDAATADPGLMAMLLSKVKDGGAISAAGMPRPDRAIEEALVSAMSTEASGAGAWTVNSSPNLTASVVQEARSAKYPVMDVYRLTVTCRKDTHEGQMLLSWAPGVPGKNQIISVAVDGRVPSTSNIEGSEKMFAGATGASGTGATILTAALPEKTLTISNLFPDETIVFPFGDLAQPVRQKLSACFAGSL